MARPSRARKKYDREDSEQRLLRAALHTFSKEGFEASTTREIAKRAGVNDSLIQRYFGGKLGLLIALFKRFRETVKNETNLDLTQELDEMLVSFFRHKLEFSKKHNNLLRIMASQAIVDSKFRKEVSMFSQGDVPFVTKRLNELKAAKKINSKVNVAQVGRALTAISISMGLLIEVIGSVEPEYADEFIPVVAEILCHGILKK